MLIAEVWGGFSPEAMRFLGELAQQRGDGVDAERTSVVDDVFHVEPRPAALAGRAVRRGCRDRARDLQECALLDLHGMVCLLCHVSP